MVNMLKSFFKEESGQDTIEYVFIGLVVALGAVAGMTTLATDINSEMIKLGKDLT